MAFSYNLCQNVPLIDTSDSTLLDPDIDKRELCIDASSVSTTRTRNCANGQTPPLKGQVEGSIKEWQYENALATDRTNATLGIDISFWMGHEVRGDKVCLWWGQEEAGICVSECDVEADGQPVLADLRALADVIVDELMENNDLITDAIASVLVVIVTALLIEYVAVVVIVGTATGVGA